MTEDSHKMLRELLEAIPLDSKQRELLEKGVSNMSARKAADIFRNLKKALTEDHKAVRESIRLYRLAQRADQNNKNEIDEQLEVCPFCGELKTEDEPCPNPNCIDTSKGLSDELPCCD